MKIRLLRGWSSVSAAAAALLGANRVPASVPAPGNDPSQMGSREPYEPLILKPAAVKVLPEERFAGHVSHSSHASHASHYSGSSGSYQQPDSAPTAVPAYSAPVATPLPFAPTYPRAIPVTPAQPKVTATPAAAEVIRIELANGTIVYGTLLVKSAAGITFEGMDGKAYKIGRKDLSARSTVELALPPEERPGKAEQPPAQPQKNTDLEQTIATLRSDNAALREQLKAQSAKPPSAVLPTAVPNAATQPGAGGGASDVSQAYWLSGTGKRHNRNCRYFGTGSGHRCGPNDGVPCKICGG